MTLHLSREIIGLRARMRPLIFGFFRTIEKSFKQQRFKFYDTVNLLSFEWKRGSNEGSKIAGAHNRAALLPAGIKAKFCECIVLKNKSINSRNILLDRASLLYTRKFVRLL